MRETRTITALNAVATGTSNAFSLADMDLVGLDVDWATGVTAGIVVLERAPTQDYAGTWKTLATADVTAVTAPATDGEAVEVVGGFVRARFTTNASGGGAPSAVVRINMSRRGN
jgi:hypothetical protein